MWRICIAFASGLLCLWSASHDPVIVLGQEPIAIEAEVEPVPMGWSFETDVPGYLGTGYLRWSAGNAYKASGSGELRYRILVTESGRYEVRLRLNTKGAEKSDLGNDVFTRFDEGTWTKTFIGGGSPNGWAIRTRLEHNSGKFADPVYELSAGLHTFCISGRSHGLRLDPIIMWRESSGKPPADTLPAQTGVSEPPDVITDEAVLSAWRQGGLGAVINWAHKQKDESITTAIETILNDHAEKELAKAESYRIQNPLLGLSLLAVQRDAIYRKCTNNGLRIRL